MQVGLTGAGGRARAEALATKEGVEGEGGVAVRGVAILEVVQEGPTATHLEVLPVRVAGEGSREGSREAGREKRREGGEKGKGGGSKITMGKGKCR